MPAARRPRPSRGGLAELPSVEMPGRVPDDFFTVHPADVRRLGGMLAPYSTPEDPLLTCTITSPPYWNLKNYGHPDQVGFGQPFDEYLVEMRRMFRTLYRHTRIDGSLWLIVDTFRSVDGSRLEPLPFQLAAEAADAGWLLRETIIWQKDKTLPYSNGRLRNGFEYVLLLVKSPKFKFHTDRLRSMTNMTGWWVKWPERYNPHGIMPTNVWEIPIPVQGSWRTPLAEHACPLPPDLIERLVLISTDPGDVVLDPFAGTGIVVAEATRLGRHGVGVELNKADVRAFRGVLAEVSKRNSTLAQDAELADKRRDTLLQLRALKYAKVLAQGLSKLADPVPPPAAMAVLLKHDPTALSSPSRPLRLQLVVAVAGGGELIDNTRAALKLVEQRPPATRFGVQASVVVVPAEELVAAVAPRKRLHMYAAGRTWHTEGLVDVRNVERLAARADHVVRGQNYRYPPILSNIEVREIPERD